LGRIWAQGLAFIGRIGLVLILVGMGGAAIAQSFTFSAVNIEGNVRVADGTILTAAGIEAGQSLSTAQLNDATQRITDQCRRISHDQPYQHRGQRPFAR